MSKVCSLTGKKVQYGNNVSHANNKSKRRFVPNLHRVSFFSDALGCTVNLKLSAAAVRSVEKKGGIDKYLLNACNCMFANKLKKMKRVISRKLAE